jgi:hypothetical protein
MGVLPYFYRHGEVKVKILHVYNASSFSARLLEHTVLGGCPVPIPDEYFTVNMAVYLHYRNQQNRYKLPKVICLLPLVMYWMEGKHNLFFAKT